MDSKIVSAITLSVPGPGNPLRRTKLSVVLVERPVRDYAAYIGAGDTDWVRKHGSKMTYAEACCFFPSMVLFEDEYRK